MKKKTVNWNEMTPASQYCVGIKSIFKLWNVKCIHEKSPNNSYALYAVWFMHWHEQLNTRSRNVSNDDLWDHFNTLRLHISLSLYFRILQSMKSGKWQWNCFAKRSKNFDAVSTQFHAQNELNWKWKIATDRYFSLFLVVCIAIYRSG